MRNPIAVIDCAINDPAIDPFNKLVQYFKHPFTYHRPPVEGIDSLEELENPLAYIILGSNSSANDELKWQLELSEFLLKRCNDGIPVLGLCFGHQLMARAFGATIGRCSEDGKKNTFLGTRKFQFIKEFLEFYPGQNFEYVVVHGEEIKTLPNCLDVVGTSNEINYEVITHKELPFIGYQGHPEATEKFLYQEIGDIKLEDYQASLRDGPYLISTFIDYAKRWRARQGTKFQIEHETHA